MTLWLYLTMLLAVPPPRKIRRVDEPIDLHDQVRFLSQHRSVED